MKEISLKELLEAGCHFGHQVTRQNPKAREFIYAAREGIHIIDLVKTRQGLMAAGDFVRDIAAKGGTIIVVGTKRQARGIAAEAVKKAGGKDNGVFIAIERWIGGTLTNFDEVGKNYRKLKDLRLRLQSDEEKAKYTKKEIGMWDKERQKLEKFYGGVCDLTKLPDVLFVIDTHKENQAVAEASRTGVPVVGIVDTNADPALVSYPIPANDDAVGSIELIVNYIVDAWMEGRKLRAKNEEQKIKSETEASMEKKAIEVEKVQAVQAVKPKPAATAKPKIKSVEKKEVKDGKRKPRATKKTS